MTFGLIGFPLSHSFSRAYFTEKFHRLGLAGAYRYENFPIEHFTGFGDLLDEYPDLRGINVTIPHKRTVMPYLDWIDPVADRIGAVNCIRVEADGRLAGFNTDYLGFRDDFVAQLDQAPSLLAGAFTTGPRDTLPGQRGLVLGTGGAALAVHEGLRSLGVATTAVSRSAGPGQITYGDLDADVLSAHCIVVNTTPLGTYPNVNGFPDLPYHCLTADHFCYDLVYNPEETAFLRKVREQGASGANGMGMLERQAEAGWAIWNQ